MKISIKLHATLLAVALLLATATQNIHALSSSSATSSSTNTQTALQMIPYTHTPATQAVLYNRELIHEILGYLGSDDHTPTLINKFIRGVYLSMPRSLYCPEFNEAFLNFITRLVSNSINNPVNIESLRVNIVAQNLPLTTMQPHPETTKLDLRDSNIPSNQLSVLLKQLPNLERLILTCCRQAPAGLRAALQANPNALQNLKDLNLLRTNISADALQAIAQRCPNLERLYLCGCAQATVGLQEALKKDQNALQNLKNLNLDSTYISADAMQAITQHCPNLESLGLAYCEQAPTGLRAALQANPNALQNLKNLNLTGTYISTNALLAITQRCPNLESLDLSWFRQATTGLQAALQANPNTLQNLKNLKLRGTDISADDMRAITQCCPNLVSLELAYCSEQAPTGLQAALQTNPSALQNLKGLFLTGSYISADAMQKIAQHCPNLETLDFSYCGEQAPDGLGAALNTDANALQNLKHLDLSNTNISAHAMQEIAQHCPNLVSLNLYSCPKAPDGLLAALQENTNTLQNLKGLNLSGSLLKLHQKELLQARLPHTSIIF